MAKITYTNVDGSADRTEWMGVRFEHGRPVETDDQALIDAAKTNPWFDVSGGESLDTDTPFQRGADAAREDKKRSVPAAYRGKSEADQWLDGFDSVKPQD